MICAYCGREFVKSFAKTNRRFCSTKCQSSAYVKVVYRNVRRDISVPNQTIGAIGEMMIACDLFKKGFETFRALSTSASCDLIALKNTEVFRIEVRTGYIYKSPNRAKRIVFMKTGRIKPDCFGVYVEAENSVYYFYPDAKTPFEFKI